MRPPLVRLTVDMQIANPGAGRRWFLVPDVVSSSSALGPVNGASVRLLAGVGRAPMAHFEGRGGFYALLLEEGSTLRVRDLTLDGDVDDAGAALAVVTAGGVTVGGVAAEAWYGVDPVCDPDANVSAVEAELVAERWPNGDPELEVVVEGTTEVATDLTLNGL